MLGAIIGDIAGSRFKWNNHRNKEFDFLTYKCFLTDDSVMSLAVAQAIMKSKTDYSDFSKMQLSACRLLEEIIQIVVMVVASVNGFFLTSQSHITAMGMMRQ